MAYYFYDKNIGRLWYLDIAPGMLQTIHFIIFSENICFIVAKLFLFWLKIRLCYTFIGTFSKKKNIQWNEKFFSFSFVLSDKNFKESVYKKTEPGKSSVKSNQPVSCYWSFLCWWWLSGQRGRMHPKALDSYTLKQLNHWLK